MAKRTNEHTETQIEVRELPREIWITIFRFIADHRLLSWRRVSKNWKEWIVQEGLEEIPELKRDFPREMENLSQYKSLTAATITTRILKERFVNSEFIECLSRLKIAFIFEKKSETEDFHLESLYHMTSLVSLRLFIVNQDVPVGLLQRLTNLRNLACNVVSQRKYDWLSDMTQLKTLSLDYHTEGHTIISDAEAQLIDQSLRNLTQLVTLFLVNPLSNFSFMEKLGSLENFNLRQFKATEHYKNFCHLTNLRSLILPPSTGPASPDLFTNLNQLECLHLPGIPIPGHFEILQQKLPKLKHLVVCITFNDFLRNSKLITTTIQSYSRELNISFSFFGVPNGVDIDETYFRLLCHAETNGVHFIDECFHCKEEECRYHYLDHTTRRIFHR